MKKIFLIIFCLMLSGAVFAVYERTDTTPYSPQFSIRMNYCIPIVDTQVFDDGTKIIRRIAGLQDHLCRYSVEKYNADGKMTEKTSCELSKSQRVELYRDTKVDVEGVAAAKDYFDNLSKNKQVCKTETFED